MPDTSTVTDLEDTLTSHEHRTIENHEPLYHVGHLDSDRSTPHFSQEGGELSVSHHPKEWRQIGDYVTGNTYELQKPNGSSRFYAIDPITRTTTVEHEICVTHEYTDVTTGYRASYEDETGDHVAYLYYKKENAEQKREWYSDVSITETEIPELAENGHAYWESVFSSDPESASPVQVRMLIPIWAALLLDVDGVYWHHPLNVPELSAPRGLIFQSRLQDWSINRIK